MRQTLKCVTGLLIAALFAACASTAAAQSPAHAELIKTLRHAHRLLIEADHDYNGHRVAAAQEVRKALKELGYTHKKGQPGAAAGKGKAKMHEPQANSDAQVREALQLLQGAVAHINGNKHPKATAHVAAAIKEINTALAIK